MKRKHDIVRDGLGVPAPKCVAVALSATSPRADYRAVGFPLLSLTRKAETPISLVLAALVLSSCSQEDALMERSWIVDQCEHLGSPIEFRSTDLFQIADVNGNVNAHLNFSKDGTIGIPGIDCPNMRGLWRLENDSLVLELDSARYRSIEEGIAQWREDRLAQGDSSVVQAYSTSQLSDLDSGVLTSAMEVFKHPFAFDISGETITLQSKTTRIVAHKDRTIDKMFEGL
jgi:hypothetical protein